MSVSSFAVKKLAVELRRKNRTRSWRTIAKEDYGDRVGYATLSRIASSRGSWYPANEETQAILGIVKKRSPFACLPKWFERTEEALEFFNSQRERVKNMSRNTRDALVRAKKG